MTCQEELRLAAAQHNELRMQEHLHRTTSIARPPRPATPGDERNTLDGEGWTEVAGSAKGAEAAKLDPVQGTTPPAAKDTTRTPVRTPPRDAAEPPAACAARPNVSVVVHGAAVALCGIVVGALLCHVLHSCWRAGGAPPPPSAAPENLRDSHLPPPYRGGRPAADAAAAPASSVTRQRDEVVRRLVRHA